MDHERPEKLILCVEDHDGMANYIRGRLSRFETTFASSYDEADRLLDLHHFSFFLLDFSLDGEKTGLDLCSRIRELGIRSPIFLMTADHNIDTDDVHRAGGDGLIRKDHNFAALLDNLLESTLGAG